MPCEPSDFHRDLANGLRRDLAGGLFDEALATRYGPTPRPTTPADSHHATDLVAAILVEHLGGRGDLVPRLDRHDALLIAREIVDRLGLR